MIIRQTKKLQNVKQLKVNSLQTAVVGYAQRIEGILNDDERREVFMGGLSSLANLQPGQRLKFHGIMIGSISVFENNLNLYRSGVLPQEQIAVYERDIVSLLKSPGASVWWELTKERYFSVSLKNHVDRILERMGPNMLPLSEALERYTGSVESSVVGA